MDKEEFLKKKLEDLEAQKASLKGQELTDKETAEKREHMMDLARGFWKSPAGKKAIARGFRGLSPAQCREEIKAEQRKDEDKEGSAKDEKEQEMGQSEELG